MVRYTSTNKKINKYELVDWSKPRPLLYIKTIWMTSEEAMLLNNNMMRTPGNTFRYALMTKYCHENAEE